MMNVQIILLDLDAGIFATWSNVDEAIKSLQALPGTSDMTSIPLTSLRDVKEATHDTDKT